MENLPSVSAVAAAGAVGASTAVSCDREDAAPVQRVDDIDAVEPHVVIPLPAPFAEEDYDDDDASDSQYDERLPCLQSGTSLEMDLDSASNNTCLDDEEKNDVEPPARETVLRISGLANMFHASRAMISAATSTDDLVDADHASSPGKIIIPTIVSLLSEKVGNEQEKIAGHDVTASPLEMSPPKDKLEHKDKLLTSLGMLPQMTKMQPSVKKNRMRDFFSRLISSKSSVEEGDGLYEQGACGGSALVATGEEGSGGEERLLHPGVVREEGAEEPEGETSLSILMQVMLPFLVAGLGMVGAGLVLDIVQHWDVFTSISELFIMVPALLGLKGNLEMTLASRLSTHANMGHLDKTKGCVSMVVGNLALIQCQAIVVGFLASVAAVVMGWIPDGEFNFLHALLLCAGALVTASFASFILGVIMVAVILISRRCLINPDNVATPIAASLGDLTTLGLLAWIASLLFDVIDSHVWLAPFIIVGYLLSLPLWVWLASRNTHTKEVLYSGWTPVISAMMISSLGGVILDYTVSSYKGIAVYQPVINGVGGNLVAVQASRISTALHLASPLGRLPRYAEKICHNPGTVFCTNSSHARTARVLLLLVIPGHLVFAYTISYLKAGHTSLTPIFVVVYLCAAILQVTVLLYMAVVMVHWMWSVSIDPDNSAIPYLTACGDLLGTGLLAIAFHLLYLVGDQDSDLGD